jgi:hypothetical protein
VKIDNGRRSILSLRRHRSSERPGAGRTGTRAGRRLTRWSSQPHGDRQHEAERSAAQARRGDQPHGGARRRRRDPGLRRGPRRRT